MRFTSEGSKVRVLAPCFQPAGRGWYSYKLQCRRFYPPGLLATVPWQERGDKTPGRESGNTFLRFQLGICYIFATLKQIYL